MREQRVLYPGARTLEIGAGSGIATRRLLELGADPLVAIEPDPRFHQMLAAQKLTLLPCRFEEAEFSSEAFDLVAVATAFHWLSTATRVQRLAAALSRGGSVALIWNLFQNPNKADAFHVATKALLADLAVSPSGAPDALPFALDKPARVAEFVGNGEFELAAYQQTHWSIGLGAEAVRSLYSGFSSISRLTAERRSDLLDKLTEIARRQFGGEVERNMTSVIYLFRRL
jgi:SAM-dependent methyltransferase